MTTLSCKLSLDLKVPEILNVPVSSFVFLSDGLCVVGGKQPCFASQLAFPPRMARAVQNLDNIPDVELQLVAFFSLETVQGFDQLHVGRGFGLGVEEANTQIQFYALFTAL